MTINFGQGIFTISQDSTVWCQFECLSAHTVLRMYLGVEEAKLCLEMFFFSVDT